MAELPQFLGMPQVGSSNSTSKFKFGELTVAPKQQGMSNPLFNTTVLAQNSRPSLPDGTLFA